MDKTIVDAIGCMDMQELKNLDSIIKARWNQLSTLSAAKSAARFYIGCKTRFEDHKGKVYEGKVVRVNTKTLSIITAAGQKWRVSPEYCAPL